MRNYGLVVVALSCCALGCGGKAPARGELTVTGTPTGKIASQLRVTLAFSRAMVSSERVDQAVTTFPLSLEPAIEGEARWTDDKTLVLVPSKSLALSTKFVATVPGDTKALDGSQLGTPHRFEFFTEQLSGTIEVVGSKDRAARSPAIKLVFTQEVPFEQVAKHCALISARDRHAPQLAPDSQAGPAKAYTIVPAAELALDTDWTMSCRTELKGSIGNLGLENQLDERFRTYGPLRFIRFDPEGTDVVPDEDLKLKLAFTNPLKPPYKISLAPTVPGFPQRCFGLGDAPPGLSCAALLEANTSYTLSIDQSQLDVFGQKLDKPQVISFRTTNAQPTISMESGFYVAELKRPVIPVWTRNVTELQVTAVEITPTNFHELSPLIDWWEAKPADLAKTRLKAKQTTLAVAAAKNQWAQQPVDPSTLFGGAPGPGMYYIEIGSSQVMREPFSAGGRQKVLVNFTDIGVVSKLSGTRGLVWATRLSTGKPLPGANVMVRDSTGRLTWTGTTDADGVAVLPPSERLSSEVKIYVQHQADWTMVDPSRSGGLSPWGYNVDVDYERGPSRLRGFMHTDRGLYRPATRCTSKGSRG